MARQNKPVWMLCPRCELNYIKKADQYCNVCKKEMKLIAASDDDIADLELCPICKLNFVQNDEEVCESCRAELGIEVDPDAVDKEISDWHRYIDDDDDEEEEEEEETRYDDDDDDTTGIVEDFDFGDDKDLEDDDFDEDDDDFELDEVEDEEDDEEDIEDLDDDDF